MREHPIPPVTEPFQYRAIGIVRGVYSPLEPEPDQFTRGRLLDVNGVELQAVVLGRVLNLMRRHISLEDPHLWVVYPRCRDIEHLHLQIAGIWEPSTLSPINVEENDLLTSKKVNQPILDELPEGDDYFSVRGELIYTKPETNDLVVKVRQQPRPDGRRPIPFKLQLKGDLSLKHLRHFVSLELRRRGQELQVEGYEIIGSMPVRGGDRKGSRDSKKKPTPRSVQRKP